MKNYIVSIVITGIICSITRSLLGDKTATGKIANILTGILMTVTVLTPLVSISFDRITDYMDGLSVEAGTYVQDGKTMAQSGVSEIIKSQVEAYILDKANSMGLDIAVEVELDDNNSVPCGITIEGTVSPYLKEAMGAYIEDKLGITRENQKWI